MTPLHRLRGSRSDGPWTREPLLRIERLDLPDALVVAEPVVRVCMLCCQAGVGVVDAHAELGCWHFYSLVNFTHFAFCIFCDEIWWEKGDVEEGRGRRTRNERRLHPSIEERKFA
jgi:hypothetical protein